MPNWRPYGAGIQQEFGCSMSKHMGVGRNPKIVWKRLGKELLTS